jgi:uncharacterized repeat protein (TIGR03803 family)
LKKRVNGRYEAGILAMLLTGCASSPVPIVPHYISNSAIRGASVEHEEVLYRFAGGADGASPSGRLILFHGQLFGVTSNGGSTICSGGCGTVYAVNPNSGREHVVYAFQGGFDGQTPLGSLVVAGNSLYGVTHTGGGSTYCDGGGCGTVFQIARSGRERVIYRFTRGRQGIYPIALATDGTLLYGVTFAGGGAAECPFGGCGTVFQLTLSGKRRTLHAFSGTNGDDGGPGSTLVLHHGRLFGFTLTTSYDGAGSTVFSMSLAGRETVIYRFAGGSTGGIPLSLALDGRGIYGTTLIGGGKGCRAFGNTSGCGIAFVVDALGQERLLHAFGAPGDGSIPTGSLLKDGILYGVTTSGGVDACGKSAGGCGTVYAITDKAEHIVYAFRGGKDGWNPQAAPILSGEAMYGVTTRGGLASCDCGIVYRIRP